MRVDDDHSGEINVLYTTLSPADINDLKFDRSVVFLYIEFDACNWHSPDILK